MEAEVFGSPRSTHILHEDILQFGEMSKISGTCIVVYMSAIKVLNVKRNRKGRKTPQWIILMGTPKQPTNTECGYFVMRYMKEIVEDKNLEFASKWSKTNEPKIKLMKYGMSGQIM
ncbi:hypothetical protein PRUPE_6G160400 [Prunus persica]|uniref:Ubiquitin-like protease family profile domain-containing protein n=1 Tax=Prunus persica TaxID=3760 RepID=A0A251NR70_PRUPE|nr:uncharacterized protein LOC109949862 [Prunus persica]ONI01811.1 hypothetical protein PRUPE_6G160400 [Prunus persica]